MKTKSQTYQSKEQLLLAQIEKAKCALTQLRQKHKTELGELAYQAGLEQFDKATIAQAFANLAKQLNQTNHPEKHHDNTHSNQTTVPTA